MDRRLFGKLVQIDEESHICSSRMAKESPAAAPRLEVVMLRYYFAAADTQRPCCTCLTRRRRGGRRVATAGIFKIAKLLPQEPSRPDERPGGFSQSYANRRMLIS